MPAPARTTNEEILAVAAALVEEGGTDALTMNAVARRVGVRPPSLYKRVRSRDQLLGQVVDRAAQQMTVALDEALRHAGPGRTDGVIALAHALRAFAEEHPRLFGLVFAQLPGAVRPSPAILERSARAVLLAAERLAGPERALDAARTITAWAYGFLAIELSGGFRLGGDPGAAFEFGAKAIAQSIDAGIGSERRVS
jgi:AcrR family transcriptional regulator